MGCRFRSQAWLVACFGGLVACANVKELELSYHASTSLEPDLVFIVGLEASGSNLYRFVASLDEASFGEAYDDLFFGSHLVSCAVERDLAAPGSSLPDDESFRGSDCLALGEYIGEVVFDGQARQVEGQGAALEPSFSVSGSLTNLFVLFVYRATQLGVAPRCVQIELAERVADGFRIKRPQGFVTSAQVSIDLEEPVLGVNCFAL